MRLRKLLIAGILSLSLIGFAGCQVDDDGEENGSPMEDEEIEDPGIEDDEDEGDD